MPPIRSRCGRAICNLVLGADQLFALDLAQSGGLLRPNRMPIRWREWLGKLRAVPDRGARRSPCPARSQTSLHRVAHAAAPEDRQPPWRVGTAGGASDRTAQRQRVFRAAFQTGRSPKGTYGLALVEAVAHLNHLATAGARPVGRSKSECGASPLGKGLVVIRQLTCHVSGRACHKVRPVEPQQAWSRVLRS